jgi:hypothetical protein
MGFWGSFWRETGKNTGKWASNKVFGRGWSTPHSHDVNLNHSGSNLSGTNNIDHSSGSNDNSSGNNRDDLLNELHENDALESQRSTEILNQDFSDNPKELFEQVSDLISQLNVRAIGIQSSSMKNGLISRARHGILLMETLGMHEAAAEFKKDLRRYQYKNYGRFVFAFLFMIFLFGALAVVLGGV